MSSVFMVLLTASFVGFFRWSLHTIRRRAAKHAVTYAGVERFKGAHLALPVSSSPSTLLTSARTVGATLERRPLVTDVHSQKDWFRLLHKVTCACISPRDVIKCSERQIELLLPLLLRVELVARSVTARLTNSSRLRLRAAGTSLHRVHKYKALYCRKRNLDDSSPVRAARTVYAHVHVRYSD